MPDCDEPDANPADQPPMGGVFQLTATAEVIPGPESPDDEGGEDDPR